jgi:uncharacterized protein (UPF0332 family)
MTDRDSLLTYRMNQAEETFSEAKKMFEEGFSPRSITNRAYYAVFYALLSLFIKADVHVTTSKHQGVISLFDREFVKPGLFDKKYSAMLHGLFDERLEADYKEFAELARDDAQKAIEYAREFLAAVKEYKNTGTPQ